MQIPTNTSECALHKSGQPLCSDKLILDKILDIAKSLNVTTNSTQQAMNELKKHTGCRTESCVVQSNPVKKAVGTRIVDENIKKNFKVAGPANSTEWLSNFNIDDVLDQVALLHKDFLHIYFQMIDFAITRRQGSLDQINFEEEFRGGIRKYGVVINTDKSTGGGQHWFAIYGEIKPPNMTIEYFNSSGGAPMPEILIWIEKVRNTSKLHVIPIIHRMPHQRDNHSCGPYALYYIISRLCGVSSETFDKKRIPDEDMMRFRQFLFRDN